MNFSARLIQLRNPASHTKQALSEAAELRVIQIRHGVAGRAQTPAEDLREPFQALSQCDSNEGMVVKDLFKGILLKRQACRPTGALS